MYAKKIYDLLKDLNANEKRQTHLQLIIINKNLLIQNNSNIA